MNWGAWSMLAAFGIAGTAYLLEKLDDWMAVNGYGRYGRRA